MLKIDMYSVEKIPMKISISIISVVLFLLIATNAQSQLNIHGVRLDMKYSEIRKLVELTEWDYKEIYDEHDEPMYFFSIVARNSFRLFGRSIINKRTHFFEIEEIAISMENGMCASFLALGRTYTPAGFDSLRGALKAALFRIKRQCGRPTSQPVNLERFTLDKLKSYELHDQVLVAEWRRKRYTVQLYFGIHDPGEAYPAIEAVSALASPPVLVPPPGIIGDPSGPRPDLEPEMPIEM